jgi:HK97 family phage major capsid protein
MNKYTVRKLISTKKKAAQKLIDATIKGDEVRDMSEDEKAQFDQLLQDVAGLKDTLAKMQEVDDRDDDDEAEDDDEKKEPEPRSARKSNPFAGQSPAIHTKRHRYSFLKAIQASEQRAKGNNVGGLEVELSQDISKRMGKQAQGLYIPLGNEAEYSDMFEQRDLTTTSGTGAVFVTPELPFIELLRNKLVLTKLGTTFLTGMEGKFSIPRQSAAATGYWVSEETAVTASNQTIDQVAFVNKTLGAYTSISRKFIYQTSVDAESFVKNDLALQLAIALENAAIQGLGTGAIPTGILYNSTIQTNSSGLALGSSGGAPTFQALVNMETQVSALNADRGQMSYLVSPAVRGTLKQTPKIANSTFPIYLWEDQGFEDDVPVGNVNGYKAYATNNVPNNLTKGSGSGLGAIIFGNFQDLVIAQWGGLDMVVNPFSNQSSGTISISMLMESDVEVRHAESFSIISDVVTSAY